MRERLTSGSARLDLILGGGLIPRATHLIIGLPGSGKTILAQQYLFHNSSREHPGIYFSTVSESLEKMLRFGQTLSFFDRDAIGTRVFFEDLGAALHSGGLDRVLDEMTRLLQELRPGLIVIDSFKALRAYAPSEEDFRRFLHGMTERTSALAVTSLWVGEYRAGDLEGIPEAAVADSIIYLGSESERTMVRRLHVLKMRGSRFREGGHAYRVDAGGIEAFPRMTGPDEGPYSLIAEPMETGIPGLDRMLGGFSAGSSTLLIGPSGIGKTVLGLHFLLEGAHRGEPGVFAGLQENPSQLEQLARSFGSTLEGPRTRVFYRAPADLVIDQWGVELIEEARALGARRIFIDGVTDLLVAAGDETTFQIFAYGLIQSFSRNGMSVVFSQESPALFGIDAFRSAGLAHCVENVILMKYVVRQGLWTRALGVLKSRGKSHSSAEGEFRILDRGMEIVASDE